MERECCTFLKPCCRLAPTRCVGESGVPQSGCSASSFLSSFINASYCASEISGALQHLKTKRIRVVLDNLSTHSAGAFYQAFPAEQARRLLRRIELHYVPKHASWLNMVEIEIGVLAGQCLDRRIESYPRLTAEVAAWEKQRNGAQARIDWSFTTEKARTKMGRAYPRPTNLKRPQKVKTSVPRN